MNKNTKGKAGLDRRNNRGTGPNHGPVGAKGPNINSSLARAASGRKPWKGHGDVLKRGKPDYKLVTPDPQGATYFRGSGQIAAPVVAPPAAPREVANLIGA